MTFLFTDVQGSTRLLDEVGAERYARLLAEHHRVCREAWRTHGGVEVDTAGDAFFVAFGRAGAALAAAALAQELLVPVGLRVRMGVHTGEARIGETGYVGPDVHRAARIAAAASGGQVLVSASTAALVDVQLRDLGEHRFKDLQAPERVFQLGDDEFPPLRSLHRSNLPVPATPFLGRTGELTEIADLLAEDAVRLVTLTGPGGTGKTRLAVEAAAEVSDRFVDGIWWVALASLRECSSVLPELAATLDLGGDGSGSVSAVCARLRDERALVLLDNAEHLLPELAHTLAALVRETRTPLFLVTSRERLRLAGETVFPVPELSAADAVELFVARARSAGVDIAATPEVEELCRRLERLPLALELAAARTVLFAPGRLLERLGERLDLLRGGRDADPRQETLRATIDWSYELLDERERRVLRALSVFDGGCSFEAAESVAGGDVETLQSLLDKSLLRRRAGRAAERFWMLETVREYVAERLAGAGEVETVRTAHAAWMLSEAERVGPLLIGPGQLDWLAVLDDELGNIRAARVTALQRGDADLAFRLMRAVAWLMTWRGLSIELLEAFEAALALPGLQPEQRCRALITIVEASPDPARRTSALAEAEQLAEGLVTDLQVRARVLELSAHYGGLADLDAQLALIARARDLHEQTGNLDEVARIVINTAVLQYDNQRYGDAETTGQEAVRRSRALGNRHKEALALANLAYTVFELGHPHDAAAHLREAIALFVELGDEVALGSCLGLGARIAITQRHAATAARLLGAWDEIHERTGVARDQYDAGIHDRLERDVSRELGRRAATLLREGAELGVPAALELAGSVLDAAGERAPVAE